MMSLLWAMIPFEVLVELQQWVSGAEEADYMINEDVVSDMTTVSNCLEYIMESTLLQ